MYAYSHSEVDLLLVSGDFRFKKGPDRKLAILAIAYESSKNDTTHGLEKSVQAVFSGLGAPFRALFWFPFRSTWRPKRYRENRASSFIFSRLASALQSLYISRSDAGQRAYATVRPTRWRSTRRGALVQQHVSIGTNICCCSHKGLSATVAPQQINMYTRKNLYL